MAKIIKLGPECIDEVRRDFEEALKNLKLSDGKISFTKTLGTIQRRAKLNFTPLAWQKMSALVREFDKEVAWHGLAYRSEDPNADEYTITDILVYPQEVTGATVTTDQEKYQTWLMDHEDDIFNNIRMQGHSHVNMAVSPSGVDTSLYDRILDQLDDTMFYIFLIWNKKGEKTIKIYDLAKNVLFETSDVDVGILGDGFDMDAFLKDAKAKVVTKSYDYGKGWNGYGYGSGYGSGYGYGGGYGASQPTKGTVAPAPSSTSAAAASAPASTVKQLPPKQETKKPEEKKKSSFGFGKKNKKIVRRSGLHVITNASGSWEEDKSYTSSFGYDEDDYYMD